MPVRPKSTVRKTTPDGPSGSREEWKQFFGVVDGVLSSRAAFVAVPGKGGEQKRVGITRIDDETTNHRRHRYMKRLILAIAIIAGVTFAVPTFAQVGQGLSGPHYNLNIIGVPKGKTVDMTDSSRHTIFVPLS